jgi:hypothetical protein
MCGVRTIPRRPPAAAMPALGRVRRFGDLRGSSHEGRDGPGPRRRCPPSSRSGVRNVAVRDGARPVRRPARRAPPASGWEEPAVIPELPPAGSPTSADPELPPAGSPTSADPELPPAGSPTSADPGRPTGQASRRRAPAGSHAGAPAVPVRDDAALLSGALPASTAAPPCRLPGPPRTPRVCRATAARGRCTGAAAGAPPQRPRAPSAAADGALGGAGRISSAGRSAPRSTRTADRRW